MTWSRQNVAAAIVGVLNTANGSTVSAFDHPPATFNPPAYVVAYPTTVVYNVPVFGVDVATMGVVCAAGIDQPDAVDSLAAAAIAALNANTTLGGVLTHGTLVVREQRNWRVITVAGAEYLTAEIILEIHM